MTFKEFFQRLTSRYLWGNLFAMAFVLVALVVGLFLFLNVYTYHGKTVVVPDLRGQRCEVAIKRLQQLGAACRSNGHRLQCHDCSRCHSRSKCPSRWSRET